MARIKQGGLGAVGITGGLVAMAALLTLPDRYAPVAPTARPMVTVAAQPVVPPRIPTAPAKPLPQAWERKVEPVAGGAPPGQAGVWSHEAEFAPPE